MKTQPFRWGKGFNKYQKTSQKQFVNFFTKHASNLLTSGN